MELTNLQRSELAAVCSRAAGDALVQHGIAEMRGTSSHYDRQRPRLRTLASAWAAIDHDLRLRIVAAIHAMWEDQSEDQPLPDLAPIIEELLEAMELPTGTPPALPGFKDAVKCLWSFWVDNEHQSGAIPPISKTARTAISAEVAPLFNLTDNEAMRRVTNTLRELDRPGDGALKGRGKGRKA